MSDATASYEDLYRSTLKLYENAIGELNAAREECERLRGVVYEVWAWAETTDKGTPMPTPAEVDRIVKEWIEQDTNTLRTKMGKIVALIEEHDALRARVAELEAYCCMKAVEWDQTGPLTDCKHQQADTACAAGKGEV